MARIEATRASSKGTLMHAMNHPHAHPFAWQGGPAGADAEEHDDRDGRFRPPRWFAMGGPRRGGGQGHGRGFGGPGFGPGFGGRGGRARRGDVRAAILRLLAEQPMHGYQIIQELSDRSGGAWNPSPGSVYPTLAALEDQGLIRATELEGRRTFSLTDNGRTEVEEAGDRGPAPWEEAAAGGGGFADLKDVAVGVLKAARQVGIEGTPAQVARAATLLRETRRKLYLLLAEDDVSDPEPT
jgi:DNA-binding PadR family transcriptional regulator